MKICVFIRELRVGGAEKQSLYLSKVLKDKYETYYVILHRSIIEKKYLDFLDENDINYLFLEGNLRQKFFAFRRFLKKNKITVIFSFLFSTNIISAIAGKLAGVPHIIGGVRNCLIVKRKFLISRFLHNHMLKYSVFNNYSGMENLTKSGFKKKKCIVIPNCFDFSLPFTDRSVNDEIAILTVARYMPQKDYFTAIKAFSLLKQMHKDLNLKYYIVGYGPEEQNIRDYIKDFQLDKNTELVIKPDNLDQYYQVGHIYLSTSLYEGLSNSIMEAMHHALPVVATNVGDNDQLIENDVNGYLCPLGDAEALSETMSKLVSSSSKRIEFGKYSHKKLKENYSLERFKEQYIDLIENL
jgi:glycosyltransferase involved in cell wall biosynthesis